MHESILTYCLLPGPQALKDLFEEKWQKQFQATFQLGVHHTLHDH